MMTKANLEIFQDAISNFKVVELEYINAQGAMSKRSVEPLALCFAQEVWTLIAYCRMRKAQREFRLDRISRLSLTSQSFPPNQFDLEDYYKKKLSY